MIPQEIADRSIRRTLWLCRWLMVGELVIAIVLMRRGFWVAACGPIVAAGVLGLAGYRFRIGRRNKVRPAIAVHPRPSRRSPGK